MYEGPQQTEKYTTLIDEDAPTFVESYINAKDENFTDDSNNE